MSYVFEGKIVNQKPRKINLMSVRVLCEKCNKIFEIPNEVKVTIENNTYTSFSYLGSSRFIYETKSGTSVTYCSKYCRDKHNHKFAKRG